MQGMDLKLNYEKEYEYVSDEYRNILQRICSREAVNRAYEADSEKQFLAADLIGMKREKFPTWSENSDELEEAYFEDIAHWVQTQKEEKDAVGADFDQLERWLTVKSCKINDTNTFLMAPCHPVVKLIDQYCSWLADEYNRGLNEAQVKSEIEWIIKKAVQEENLRNRENFYVYGTAGVYYSMRKDGCRRAIPWQDVGSLTEIDSLRLIEKVRMWAKRNLNRKGSKQKVRIAYFGIINDPDNLNEYFKQNRILPEKPDFEIKVTFTRFERIPRNERYIFKRTDDAQGKKVYNLSVLADMKELFRNFDIVLFLDESYFYRQRQWVKELDEKGAADYVKWCLQDLERRSDNANQKNRKISYYQQLYNRAGLWMNGYGEERTSKLGFDTELFDTIEKAHNPKCDVYLYISRGKTIGRINLLTQSICNDERYDGRKLRVYKIMGKDDPDEKAKTCEAVHVLLMQNNVLAAIDLWKLVKSIGRDFSKEFSKWLQTDDIYKIINI